MMLRIIIIGYDLLPVNIEAAKDRFKNESWVFDTWDLAKDRIGRGTSPEYDYIWYSFRNPV